MVRRTHPESVEQQPGLKRLIRRLGFRDRQRLRRVCDWFGDLGVNFIAFDPLWNDRFPADLRICSTDRGNGIGLDDGQARSDLPRRGRLRPGDAVYLWTGRPRFDRTFGTVSLGPEHQLETASGGLRQKLVRRPTLCGESAAKWNAGGIERMGIPPGGPCERESAPGVRSCI